MCVTMTNESKVGETKNVISAVGDVKKKGDSSFNIYCLTFLFGQILLYLAYLQESSVKKQFCDQRNWSINHKAI